MRQKERSRKDRWRRRKWNWSNWTLQPCILLGTSRRLTRRATPRKLYLNLKISQVGSQLFWRLIVNNGKAEAARAFEIERAIVNEDALFGHALGDCKRYAEDTFFGFARMDVAGTEKDLEASA